MRETDREKRLEAPEEYAAANEYTEDVTIENTSLESTGTDENAALISEGANAVFDGVEITRTSSESKGGDASSFYGVGAALLAEDGTALVKNSTITTDAAGGAGLFAYGNGTVYAADSTIKTSQDTSGGIHAAGGGTMVVDSGKYVSNGVGSPAVYCTADIAVNNAELTANGSEAVCIEGLNSLHLYNTNLTGNMSDDEQNDTTWTVTGDSKITSLSSEGTIVDTDGKTVTIKGEDGTVYVEGDSAYTITTGSYQDSADLSGSTAMDAWSDYEAERPAEL